MCATTFSPSTITHSPSTLPVAVAENQPLETKNRMTNLSTFADYAAHLHDFIHRHSSGISPETGREVGEGETGLIRLFDLANVYSVMAIQTEDLGARHGSGFELLGRAAISEPRGCSLQSA